MGMGSRELCGLWGAEAGVGSDSDGRDLCVGRGFAVSSQRGPLEEFQGTPRSDSVAWAVPLNEDIEVTEPPSTTIHHRP